MSRQHKYLVTTNAKTGEIESVEQIGSAGELIRVDPGTLLGASVAPQQVAAQPQGEAEPGVFLSPELPDVRSEAAAGGVFVSSELPDVETIGPVRGGNELDVETIGPVRGGNELEPGVFFGSAELPEVRTEEAAPGVIFHSSELPDVAAQGH